MSFHGSKGCLTQIRVKHDVNNAGGHLAIKRGGKSDLNFYILDVSGNIFIWGVILLVLKGALLKSRLQNDVHHTKGHLVEEFEPHFYNKDVRRNIV